jgi:hypothetical protein
MKFAEKLFSVGLTPRVYDRDIVRTVEDEATGRPLPLTGRSVVVIH